MILNQKHNDYLASINDSILSLCCYEILDIIISIDFEKGDKLTDDAKDKILGNKIEDFFFC